MRSRRFDKFVRNKFEQGHGVYDPGPKGGGQGCPEYSRPVRQINKKGHLFFRWPFLFILWTGWFDEKPKVRQICEEQI